MHRLEPGCGYDSSVKDPQAERPPQTAQESAGGSRGGPSKQGVCARQPCPYLARQAAVCVEPCASIVSKLVHLVFGGGQALGSFVARVGLVEHAADPGEY